MKDKTAAAKLLLDNGWTLDEVLRVLSENKSIEYHYHYPAYVPYWSIVPPQPEPIYRRYEIICESTTFSTCNMPVFVTET